jgi:hypothetical protein
MDLWTPARSHLHFSPLSLCSIFLSFSFRFSLSLVPLHFYVAHSALGPSIGLTYEFERSRKSESAPLLSPADVFLSPSPSSFFILVPFFRVSRPASRMLPGCCTLARRRTAFCEVSTRRNHDTRIYIPVVQARDKRYALFTLLLQLSFLMILCAKDKRGHSCTILRIPCAISHNRAYCESDDPMSFALAFGQHAHRSITLFLTTRIREWK